MLIVADERSFRICGQRRLARTRKSKEQCSIASWSHIRRAVHRQNSLLRKQVVHHCEHRLLELAGVAGTADQYCSLGDVQNNERSRARAVLCWICLEFRRMEHSEVRIER